MALPEPKARTAVAVDGVGRAYGGAVVAGGGVVGAERGTVAAVGGVAESECAALTAKRVGIGAERRRIRAGGD
ncbi:hypothetical protein BDS110ZK17_82050 [Bradyrhizobium diazoefficiens]|nr:hypothetical protein XF16B_58570 [Bradyrhizobium diazoefficiens]BCF71517.1 hypothetical protein XF19B_58700 [Bradyrhizobium diazoefficiens]